MKLFRLPTRFLIVVELGLALLGALGLTYLRGNLARHCRATSRVPQVIVVALCAGTAMDLWIHQPRQNPMVSGRDWLAPPPTVAALRGDSSQPRTFTPRHRELHGLAFERAHGWVDTTPYFELRDVLAPNTGGGYWNAPSADCYAGIAARWHVDVWGDHNRQESLVFPLAQVEPAKGILSVHPALPKVLRANGVSHVLSPFPQEGTALEFMRREGYAYIYRVAGSARVRFVPSAIRVTSGQEATARFLNAGFDPDREILLHDVPDAAVAESAGPRDTSAGIMASRAVVMREDSQELVIDAEAPQDGYLLLADTYLSRLDRDSGRRPYARLSSQRRGKGHPAAEGPSRCPVRVRRPGLFPGPADHAAGGRGARVGGVSRGLCGPPAFLSDRARRYLVMPSEPQKPTRT